MALMLSRRLVVLQEWLETLAHFGLIREKVGEAKEIVLEIAFLETKCVLDSDFKF